MIKDLFKALLGNGLAEETFRARLEADEMPAALYAIGDVHGRFDLLKALEARIYADGDAFEGEKWIVMLGDLIDRGPASAQVLDHMLHPPPQGWRRICLCGNHDHTMAAAMRDKAMMEQWLSFGGVETLASYGVELGALADAGGRWSRLQAILDSSIPSEHIRFLDALPIMLAVPGYVFVHAGLRPGVPLERQTDDDMMWIRTGNVTPYDVFPFVIVHGHTPTDTVDLSAQIINIDTGAFASGILTAIRITPDKKLTVIQTTGAESGKQYE
ncbi:metallophosphoesterase [Pelagibacterium halotolerans]|uniref:metallophosphoesterase n=1 Tax=Pelagibacterium halotolerans TaxID=531813 RepID=UPI00384DEAE5